jgi:acyl dehydratase
MALPQGVNMIVREGDQVPPWTMASVSAERMQTMAAILRDPNPLHWDRKSVAQLGLGERCINQGPLGVGYMVNMLQSWAGENCIRRMFIRFPNPLILDGDHIVSNGKVTRRFEENGASLAEVETWLDRDGQRGLIEATVTIQLP